MFDNYITLIIRELRLSASKWTDLCSNLFFLLISTSLFAFAFAQQPLLLHKIGGHIMVIIMLFSLTISSAKLFEEDYNDGTMDQLIMAELIPSNIFLSKIFSSWILNIIPLVLILPVFALMFDYDLSLTLMLLLVLLLILPLLVLICGFVSLLAVGTSSSAYLTVIIALPLNISVVLLSSSCLDLVMQDAKWSLIASNLGLILGLLLILTPIMVFFGGMMLKEKL